MTTFGRTTSKQLAMTKAELTIENLEKNGY